MRLMLLFLFTYIANCDPNSSQNLGGAGKDTQQSIGATKLFPAIEAGNVAEVEKLIKQYKLNLNDKDENGYTPLLQAILHDRAPIVKLLLEHGAKVDEKSDTGLSPVMLATFLGEEASVNELVLAQADVSEKGGENSASLLLMAIISGNANLLKTLLKAGIDKTNIQNACDIAASLKKSDLVTILGSSGAESPCEPNETTKFMGANRLHFSSMYFDDPALINYLISKGESVKDVITDDHLYLEKFTPLLVAVKHKHPRTVAVLLQNGSDINARADSYEQISALTLAIKNHDIEMLKLLIKNKVDIKAFYDYQLDGKKHKGNVLHWLIIDGVKEADKAKEIAKILIAEGVDKDAKSDAGQSPLYLAIDKSYNDESNRAIVEALIESSVDVNEKISKYSFRRGIISNINFEVTSCSMVIFAILHGKWKIVEEISAVSGLDKTSKQCHIKSSDGTNTTEKDYTPKEVLELAKKRPAAMSEELKPIDSLIKLYN